MAFPFREADDFTSSPDLCVISGPSLLLQEREKLSHHYGCGTGVRSIDVHFPTLFRGGRVIGVGKVGDGEGANVLSTRVLVSALVSMSDSPPITAAGTTVGSSHRPHESPVRAAVAQAETEVFILAPPSSTVVSDVHALLRSRLADATATSTVIDHNMSQDGDGGGSAAFKLLDNVKLLQYLDLAGLVEGVSEVSQRLHKQQQQPEKKQNAVVVVKGLSSALTLAHRRSGTVQVAAVAASLLRSLMGLSRTFPGGLVLVDLAVGVGGGQEEGGALQSAFVGEKEEVMGVLPSGVLGDVLQRGMDVVVVVHDGFGKARKLKGGGVEVKTKIVEVVKDGMGGGFGGWSLWVY